MRARATRKNVVPLPSTSLLCFFQIVKEQNIQKTLSAPLRARLTPNRLRTPLSGQFGVKRAGTERTACRACHLTHPEAPRHHFKKVVEDDGIEPTTPCLQSRCSPS